MFIDADVGLTGISGLAVDVDGYREVRIAVDVRAIYPPERVRVREKVEVFATCRYVREVARIGGLVDDVVRSGEIVSGIVEADVVVRVDGRGLALPERLCSVRTGDARQLAYVGVLHIVRRAASEPHPVTTGGVRRAGDVEDRIVVDVARAQVVLERDSVGRRTRVRVDVADAVDSRVGDLDEILAVAADRVDPSDVPRGGRRIVRVGQVVDETVLYSNICATGSGLDPDSVQILDGAREHGTIKVEPL